MSELFEQAKVHLDRNEIVPAADKLTDHLNSDFNDYQALFMLGACYLQLGKHGVAAALLRQSFEIRRQTGHKFPEALKNLGACFKGVNKIEHARELWKLALEIEEIPAERAQLMSNLGGSYVNDGNPAAAIEWCNKAIVVAPNLLPVRFNKGLAELEAGDWPNGWSDFAVGFKSGDRRHRRYKNLPEWDGSPGKRVIVWGDQGVGDEIMYASMLPDLARVSKAVIFDCHPRLEALMKRSFPDITVHGTRKTMSHIDWVEGCEADCSIALSSLGIWFRQKDTDFPGVPYLKSGLYGQRPGPRPSIGISWRGGTPLTRSDLRSIPLVEWAPLLKEIDADFYSLQYTPDAAKEVCELEEETGIRVRHYPGCVACKDYDRTASFVGSMDLVITVCTAVHHLSNALGVPTWTLVPSKPAWRYGVGSENWYRESNRYFRQAPGEPWGSVINRVGEALADQRTVSRAEPAAA